MRTIPRRLVAVTAHGPAPEPDARLRHNRDGGREPKVDRAKRSGTRPAGASRHHPSWRAKAERRSPRLRRSSAFAVATSTPLRQQRRELHVAFGGVERALRRLVVALREMADHSGRPADELGVADAHVHHQPAIDAPQADHHQGRKQVEDDLLRRARLHPRGPGQDLRPGIDQDRVLGRLDERRIRIVGDADRQRAAVCVRRGRIRACRASRRWPPLRRRRRARRSRDPSARVSPLRHRPPRLRRSRRALDRRRRWRKRPVLPASRRSATARPRPGRRSCPRFPRRHRRGGRRRRAARRPLRPPQRFAAGRRGPPPPPKAGLRTSHGRLRDSARRRDRAKRGLMSSVRIV